MIKIYISNSHDVYTNVALERYLFKSAKQDLILFFWSNNPCVVIGRNQNVYDEVNIEYAHQNGIDIIRRFSGGGAVYQDQGNLNYTLICDNFDYIEWFNKILINTFNNLGFNVSLSGRNDLVIDGRKFSGIAYCNDFDHFMYHGTCLVNVNVDTLNNVLKPHQYKLESHSVKSYRSRVINLKEIKDIDNQQIINSFIEILHKECDVKVMDSLPNDELITEWIKELKDKDYIYEDCPSYNYSFDLKLNNSNYHFDLNYDGGFIKDCKVYCDDLDISKSNFYQQHLINKKIKLDDLKSYLQDLK